MQSHVPLKAWGSWVCICTWCWLERKTTLLYSVSLTTWLLKCCFTSTETVGLLGTGAQDGHLDFHTAPKLWTWLLLLCSSVDILGTSWDQCVSMVQYCFTSTETIKLVRTGSPGRPPRLSHSSWTLWTWLGSAVLLNVLGRRLTYYIIWDKLRPMPKHGLILLYVHGNLRLVRTDSPGQPPPLSHSSWTMGEHDCAGSTICRAWIYTD